MSALAQEKTEWGLGLESKKRACQGLGELLTLQLLSGASKRPAVEGLNFEAL